MLHTSLMYLCNILLILGVVTNSNYYVSRLKDFSQRLNNQTINKMNEDNKMLNNKRKGYKARIIDFNSYINKVVMMFRRLSSSELLELKLRVEKAESIYTQYEEIQSQLESVGFLIQPDVSVTFESQFYRSLAIAKDLICKETNKILTVTSSCDKNTQTDNSNLLQFPTIQLPKFNGSYGNWLDFREAFKYLIHSNDFIEDIEKFRYLRASMEDSAAVLIQTVDFSASNYVVAWKLINERYNNINKLVNHHMSCLFNVESIEMRSSTMLKGFIKQLDKNLRALELLGQPVKYWDIFLLYIFTSKLDDCTRREWYEFSSHSKEDSSITVDLFLQFLRTCADLIEARDITKNETDSTV